MKGSAYDNTTIKDLLQMASGVQWNEDYADPDSDIATASWQTPSLYDFLRDKPRVAEAGERFNYNTAETNLAGTLLRSAIGNNLSSYLSEKIWQPFGMEADASWQLTEPNGGEFGGCCINATLRDYARLGLFALENGTLADGTGGPARRLDGGIHHAFCRLRRLRLFLVAVSRRHLPGHRHFWSGYLY